MSGVVAIPPFTVHEYGRADDTEEGKSSRDVMLRIREWTDPGDGAKEVFFRNITSCLKDKQEGTRGTISLLLSIFCILRAHDTYPVVVSGPAWLGGKMQKRIRELASYTVLGVVGSLGKLAGFKGTYEEYTPNVRGRSD